MQLNAQSDMPLYKQLSQILSDRIANSEWKVNEKIPPEPELCAEYNVSRMTVRLALDELTKKGSIYRRQGKGTFVSPPLINQQLSYFYSFNGKSGANSYNVNKVIVNWEITTADDEQREQLKLGQKDLVFVITRLLLTGSTPFAIEESCIPVNLCPSLSKESVEANGLYNSLNEYNLLPNRAFETLEAIIIPKNYQKMLNEVGPTQGFKVLRTSYHDDLLVEFCRSCVNGKLIKYNVSLS